MYTINRFARLAIGVLVMLLTGFAWGTTLTLTANSYKVHVGDPVPPCTFTPVDSSGTYLWATAVASGYPTCTTSYTSASGVGTYTQTIAVGSMVAGSGYSFVFVAGSIVVEAPTGRGAQNPVVPLPPSGMIQSLTNALGSCSPMVGDGVTLNNPATTINCYMQTGRSGDSTYGTAPKQFYLPCGTYLIPGQVYPYSSAFVLVGAGRCTVLKLPASTSGYTNPAIVNDFVYIKGYNGNDGFDEHLENLDIEIGPGNPGVNAVTFVGNNFDGIRNVRVYSDDSAAKTGFAFQKAYPGQTILKNLSAYGFVYCLQANGQNEYNMVAYNLTCEDQSGAGIITGALDLAVSNYFSVNSVPAWANTSAAQVLLGAELIGTGSGNAITNGSTGTFYARDITVPGYTNSMVDSNGGATLTGNINEHWSGTAQCLFNCGGTPTGRIITPVETPVASDSLTSGVLNGCALPPNVNNWTTTAAGCAYTTVYVPVLDNYPSNGTDSSTDANKTGVYTPSPGGSIIVNLDCNINHFMGNGFTLLSGTSITIHSIGTTCNSTPLIIDHITGTASAPSVSQDTSRPVVVEDMNMLYYCSAGAGTLYLEDVQVQASPTTFCAGQTIYARGLDAETEGGFLGVSNVAYVQATNTLTLQMSSSPDLIPGAIVDFYSIIPSTWLGPSGTVSTSMMIQTVVGTTVTGLWSGMGSHADQAATAQTGGNGHIQYDKIQCTGCNLWVQGLKTEKNGAAVNITNGKLEVDGGFWYPIRPAAPGGAAFKITDSNYAITGSNYGCCSYYNWVTETRSGTTLQLANPNGGNAPSTPYNLNFAYSLGVSIPSQSFGSGRSSGSGVFH